MTPNVLLIRADASLAIGTGHVMRCLALAQAWQDSGGSADLATSDLPDALAPRLKVEGLSIHRVHARPGSLDDAAETIALAHRLNAHWIVIDGDRFGSDFLVTVRNAGFRVLLIDDFAERESYAADLIVNLNLDADEGSYRKRGATAQLLMGPSYVLLRREFKQGTEKREIRALGNRILVTMGGSDPENLTPKIAAALSHCPDLAVTVVAGPGYDKVAELHGMKTSNLNVVIDPPSMVPFTMESDQAIIAAGGTLWELLSSGCAVLSYSRNIVQARVVQALSDRRIVVNMGETCDFDPAKLVASVNGLVDARAMREQMAMLGHGVVDGLGAMRVIDAIRQLGIQ